MNNNNDLKVAEIAKNFAMELGRELLRNNRARARVRRYLREKHKVKTEGENHGTIKCDGCGTTSGDNSVVGMHGKNR